MRVYICAAGAGDLSSLTAGAEKIINEAGIVTGAERLVRACGAAGKKIPAVLPADILAVIEDNPDDTVCVLMSGDTGFYSGALRLGNMLSENGIEYEVLPGVSSMQYLSSRIKRPWQDWTLASMHGKGEDIIGLLMKGRPVFLLTGSGTGPKEIGLTLLEAGLGGAVMTVGERLSYHDEKVTVLSAAEAAERDFDPLNVVLIEGVEAPVKRASGIDDSEFIRGEVPMTKQEIRAVCMAKSGIGEDSVCWDIGAGTGSVSVEMALLGREVWAVERVDAGIDLIRANREKFACWNIHVLKGEAPGCLGELPAPDFVFVGGSGGHLEDILRCALEKNENAAVMVTAIALETLGRATEAFKNLGLRTEIVQVSCSRAEDTGRVHMLKAENPIFILKGSKQ